MADKTWTWAFVGSVYNYDHDRNIEICKACGVHALEFHPQGVSGLRDDEIRALRKKYADEGIAIASFHLPFPAEDDIASFYETQRRGAAARMAHWIGIAGLLGARVAVQHPTTNRLPADENGLDRYFEQMYKSLNEMLPAARKSNVIIGLENMTPGEHGGGRFFSKADHFRRFSKEFPDPHIGYVYDTGHALLSAGPKALDILEAMGARLSAWHMADNAGDRDSHLAPGHGEVDWNGVFRFAARLKFAHPMTMETAPWGAGPDYAIEAWQRSVAELDDLVAKV